MTRTEILDQLDDMLVLALTLFGEARGEPVEGVVAVGAAIRNRVRHPNPLRFGDTYKAVCLKPAQFSCWTEGDPTNALLMKLAEAALCGADRSVLTVQEADAWLQCRWVASGLVLNLLLTSVIGSANHYYNPTKVTPGWSRDASLTPVGPHVLQRFEPGTCAVTHILTFAVIDGDVVRPSVEDTNVGGGPAGRSSGFFALTCFCRGLSRHPHQ